MNDAFQQQIENTYLQMLNSTPSTMIPQAPPQPTIADTFDGVSQDVINLKDLQQKLNDVNKSLTEFETKSNQWHDFLIQSRGQLDVDPETFKQYEVDQQNTLLSINKIKNLLLQIKSQLGVLKDTLKQ